MHNSTKPQSRKSDYLVVAVGMMPFVTLGAVLWAIGLPLLSRATATSLLAATGITLLSFARVIITHRTDWREWIVPAMILHAILWPLGLVVLSQNARAQ
jgi:hypothetical protein